MSGTQHTMADAHPPGAQVFKLPSYCMPLPVDPPRPGIECGIGDSESDSEDDKPSYADLIADTDNYDSEEDDKPLKMPKTPIKKPKPPPSERQYPVKLDKDGVWRYRPEQGDPPPSERQYPVKLDKDGVWRYRPEEGDFKPQKREDKLTCTFKTKKAKGKPLGKSKSKVKRSLDKAMDEV